MRNYVKSPLPCNIDLIPGHYISLFTIKFLNLFVNPQKKGKVSFQECGKHFSFCEKNIFFYLRRVKTDSTPCFILSFLDINISHCQAVLLTRGDHQVNREGKVQGLL